VKGGRLIELKSVAANPPLRRRLIAAGIATYFPLAFIKVVEPGGFPWNPADNLGEW